MNNLEFKKLNERLRAAECSRASVIQATGRSITKLGDLWSAGDHEKISDEAETLLIRSKNLERVNRHIKAIKRVLWLSENPEPDSNGNTGFAANQAAINQKERNQ